MSCDGIKAFNPLCRAREVASQAASDAFTRIAQWFGKAAADATTWLWDQIGSATSINLDSPHLMTDLAATGAIALVLCLGLFLLQVITGVLRRDPGALGRAARGLVIALVASAFALTVTKVLLGVVDQLSAGFVQYTMHTNIEGLGRQLALGSAISAYSHNPAMMLIFSLVILAAVVVVWAAMMIRKMMIIIAAVLTPLAFSGATADITRSWVRRWIEFMAAMIVSKLLLVIILMVGVSVVEGAGQTADAGPGQLMTQLATGSLILLMGGFAPWVAIKMFHFAGESLHNAHVYAAQAPSGARTVAAAPQKLTRLHMQTQAAVTQMSRHGQHGAGANAAPPHRGDDPEVHTKQEHLHQDPPSHGPNGGSDAAPGAESAARTPAGRAAGGASAGTGSGAASGGASAGAASSGAAGAGPIGAAVAAGGAVYSAGRQTVSTAGRAAQRAASSNRPPHGGAEATAPGEEAQRGQPSMDNAERPRRPTKPS